MICKPSQGTTSSHITDIWVDDNSDYRGIYQIPVSVPILQTGPTTISLQAVVEENGIASNLLPYPFDSTPAKIVNLQPGKLDTINPVFYYSSRTNFHWMEGFDNTNSLKTTAQNTANVHVTTIKDSVFDGTGGTYEVDMAAGQTFYAGSGPSAFIPPPSYVVWLEMNYKTDVPMDVGINLIDPSNGRRSILILALNCSSSTNTRNFRSISRQTLLQMPTFSLTI